MHALLNPEFGNPNAEFKDILVTVNEDNTGSLLFGVGVTIGNLVGARLADWRQTPALIGIFYVVAVARTRRR